LPARKSGCRSGIRLPPIWRKTEVPYFLRTGQPVNIAGKLWSKILSKRMSRTLAAEIAERTMQVVNPQNRHLALSATLRRHGFESPAELPRSILDKSELTAWLLAAYPGS